MKKLNSEAIEFRLGQRPGMELRMKLKPILRPDRKDRNWERGL
jgi:hypothetical protein